MLGRGSGSGGAGGSRLGRCGGVRKTGAEMCALPCPYEPESSPPLENNLLVPSATCSTSKLPSKQHFRVAFSLLPSDSVYSLLLCLVFVFPSLL